MTSRTVAKSSQGLVSSSKSDLPLSIRTALSLAPGSTKRDTKSRTGALTRNARNDLAARMTGSVTKTANIANSSCGSATSQADSSQTRLVGGPVTVASSSKHIYPKIMELQIRSKSSAGLILAESGGIGRAGSGAASARRLWRQKGGASRPELSASTTSTITTRAATLPEWIFPSGRAWTLIYQRKVRPRLAPITIILTDRPKHRPLLWMALGTIARERPCHSRLLLGSDRGLQLRRCGFVYVLGRSTSPVFILTSSLCLVPLWQSIAH